MKTRKHLEELHKTLAESHGRQAEYHATVAEHYAKLAGQVLKAAKQDDAAAHLTSIAEAHQKMHGHHAEAAALHEALAEECTKAETGGLEKSADVDLELFGKFIDQRIDKALGDQTFPPVMSRVAPTVPAMQTLVPRAGSPVGAPKVPLEFAKLIAVDDECSI